MCVDVQADESAISRGLGRGPVHRVDGGDQSLPLRFGQIFLIFANAHDDLPVSTPPLKNSNHDFDHLNTHYKSNSCLRSKYMD
jgi:hypothetical protein